MRVCIFLQERATGADKDTNGDTLRESSYVISQVAYLCQSVSPELANKATNAAMSVLLKVRPVMSACRGREIRKADSDSPSAAGGTGCRE